MNKIHVSVEFVHDVETGVSSIEMHQEDGTTTLVPLFGADRLETNKFNQRRMESITQLLMEDHDFHGDVWELNVPA